MGCACNGGMRNTGRRAVIGPRHNSGIGLRATQAPPPSTTPISAQSVSGMSKRRLDLERKRREAIMKKLGKR
jgi:hypothetical protein